MDKDESGGFFDFVENIIVEDLKSNGKYDSLSSALNKIISRVIAIFGRHIMATSAVI